MKFLAVGLSIAVLAAATAAFAGPEEDARALAEKFAHGGDAAAPVSKPQQTPHQTPKQKPAPVAAATASRPPLDYEIDMLRRARIEQLERVKNEAQAAPRQVQAEATPAPNLAPSLPPSLPPSLAPTPAPVAAQAQVQAQTQAPAPAAPAVAPPAAAEPKLPPAAPAPVAKAEPEPTGKPQPAATVIEPNGPRATVLLAIDPPFSNSKDKGAPPDAIICIADVCYASLGFDTGAMPVARAQVVAMKSTDEVKAAFCKGQYGCVFRDVVIPASARIEIIDASKAGTKSDLGDVSIDQTCKIDDGDLDCKNAAATVGQRAWIVPESVARKAGVTAIEEALADGLPEYETQAGAGK